MEDAYNNEAFILDIGQCFQRFPDGADQDPSSIWSVATKQNDEADWEWQTIFSDINVAQDTVHNLTQELEVPENALTKIAFIKHNKKATTTQMPKQMRVKRHWLREHGRHLKIPLLRRERHWLRRHGRQSVLMTGWDGTPPEVQPFFQYDDFAKAYHVFLNDIADKKTASADPLVNDDVKRLQQDQQPTWASTSWLTSSTPAFNAKFTEVETITGPMSSDDEGAGDEGMGRAAKQALKKETPWRSINTQDRPHFVKATQAEWAEWVKWASCKPVYPKPGTVDRKLVLKSRICYRWKPQEGGRWHKAKSRIVVQGYLDPHLPLLSRDAPVLARSTLVLIIQWAACYNVSLHNGDCKSAFLQGEPDTERPVQIYMKPPQDPIALEAIPEWNHPLLLYALTAPVYGQANAPRRWFLHVLKVMLEAGWRQHTLDPCCFLQVAPDPENYNETKVVAILGIHVDDVICACLDGFEHHLEQVKGAFEWGSAWEKDDFIFTGRRIQRQPDGSFTIDQSHYVADISLTKLELPDDEKLADHPELVTEFRSGIGSLQWMAGTTRGDLAADTSLLQKPPKDLCVGDLREINKVLKYVRATADSYFKVNPLSLKDLVFVAYGDSGWANAPGNKSQGGLVILATEKQCLETSTTASLLEWKSYRHQRTLRSTLAAEAASLDRAFDTGNFLACVFSELVYGDYRATTGVPLMEVIPVTDARSLWDAIHRLSTTFSEKRVEIDVAALRESCRSLRWVPTEQQTADALTKRSPSLRDTFRKFAMAPTVTLTDSKSATDGADNGQWKSHMLTKEKKDQCQTEVSCHHLMIHNMLA